MLVITSKSVHRIFDSFGILLVNQQSKIMPYQRKIMPMALTAPRMPKGTRRMNGSRPIVLARRSAPITASTIFKTTSNATVKRKQLLIFDRRGAISLVAPAKHLLFPCFYHSLRNFLG